MTRDPQRRAAKTKRTDAELRERICAVLLAPPFSCRGTAQDPRRACERGRWALPSRACCASRAKPGFRRRTAAGREGGEVAYRLKCDW